MECSPIDRIEIVSADAGWKVAQPLFEAVWPPDVVARLPWKDILWALPEQRVLAFDRTGELLGHAEFLLRDAKWDGLTVKIFGIGGVVTHADQRRRGIASRVLQRAIGEANDADFGLLFCEPRHAPVYEKLGWRRFAGEVFALQPQGRIRFSVTDPYLLDFKVAPRGGVIDLCGLPW
jgi:GNAT superfamily N-acetyltransferase